MYVDLKLLIYPSPPKLSPLAAISLLSKSVSPFLFCKEIHFYNLFRFHVWVISYDTCLWLISLSMIISRPIHVAANGIISLFFIFHCIYVSHILYPFFSWWTFRLHPCLVHCKWTLGCMLPFKLWFSLYIYPGVGLLDHVIVLHFSF